MKRIVNNPVLIRLGTRLRNLLFAGVAAIPVGITASYYLKSEFDHHAGDMAVWVAIYFIVCLYVGRYASSLWVKQNESVPRSVFKILGAVIVLCILLVFFFAEFTANLNRLFIKILLVGLPFSMLSLAMGSMIKLIRVTIKNQLTEAKAVAEQSQSELRFLQSQLSPHFLFNTLNNMYGLSLTQHEKVPGLLLKLSDLLRYSVYDAKELYVPLKNEVAYIKDYIDFEKIRIGEKLELTTSVEEPIDPDVKIAPLLLIVFIENAFKHSKNTTEQKIYINITLKTWANSILFSIKNSNNENKGKNDMLKENSGFGLENVMKRLELLYKDKYDLKIDNTEGYYHVMLQLKWK
ncbi:MAG TPA: histidine kinase [Chitinophagaceae bacterium]|nr:histidine kinase [Chitinophagaceae bacterium]